LNASAKLPKLVAAEPVTLKRTTWPAATLVAALSVPPVVAPLTGWPVARTTVPLLFRSVRFKAPVTVLPVNWTCTVPLTGAVTA
jgi:hypothetical protein